MPTIDELITKVNGSNLSPEEKTEIGKLVRAKEGEVLGVKRTDLRQAFPTILATFGAALLGASAEKGSVLRYSGAVPGVIELFDKAGEKGDAGEVIIPLVTAAVGGAAPALIK